MPSLTQLAQEVRKNAYAPYSGYQVGSAIEGPGGRVWTGCNVENVSYGVSICAERSAVAKMVADGFTEILGVAVATPDGGTPCGICLQVMSEFIRDPDSVEVATVDDIGDVHRYRMSELLPHGFKSDRVNRTNPTGD